MKELLTLGKISYKFDIFSSFKEIGRENYSLYFSDKYENYLNNEGEIIVISKGFEINAFLIYGRDDMESSLLGMEVVKLEKIWADNFEAALELIERFEKEIKDKFDFTVVRLAANNFHVITALSQKGYMLVDTLVSFLGTEESFRYDYMREVSSNLIVREPIEDDYNRILRLCKLVFGNYPSRYFVDPNIGKKKSIEIYLTWIKDVLRKENNKFLVAVDEKGKFCTFSFVMIYEEPFFEKHFGFKFGYSGLTSPVSLCSNIRNIYVPIVSKLILLLYDDGITKNFLDTQLLNYSVFDAAWDFGKISTFARYTFHKNMR